MTDEVWYCKACRECQLLHCSDLDNCGGMQKLPQAECIKHQEKLKRTTDKTSEGMR